MVDLDREHLLQKIVAVSGFVFALLILPVAQYFLVQSRSSSLAEQGTVAGVSTDKTVTNADVPADPTACAAKKNQDLVELQAWDDSRMTALTRDYNAAVQPYQAAFPVVTGDVAAEQAALNKLIAEQTDQYTLKKAEIQAAVDEQTKVITERSCTPAP